MRAKKRSEYKLEIREQARRKVRGSKFTAKTQKQYGDKVESGLGALRTTMAEDGDGKAKRAKNELLYLINNYNPRYDARILQLIDEWRRSGDPSYDPGIRLKYRRARQDQMKDSDAL
jgi:hypothetical protein